MIEDFVAYCKTQTNTVRVHIFLVGTNPSKHFKQFALVFFFDTNTRISNTELYLINSFAKVNFILVIFIFFILFIIMRKSFNRYLDEAFICKLEGIRQEVYEYLT